MTDTPPVPPTPETPATPPAAPAAGAVPPAPGYAPAAAGPKQTQSLIGFLLGIGSIVFSGLGIIGIGLGIAGLIVTRKAKVSEPGAPSWMHTAGLITSIAGIILSIIVGLLVFIGTILPFILIGNSGYYS